MENPMENPHPCRTNPRTNPEPKSQTNSCALLHRHEGVKILDDNEESLYREYKKAVGGGPLSARVLASTVTTGCAVC